MPIVLLAMLFSLATTAGNSQTAHEQVTGAGFTYFVLSLYWLPSLCLESPHDDACHGVRHDGFVVHGLQPTLNYGSPVNCRNDAVLSDSLVTRVKDLLPTRKLVEREWAEHGSCSGLGPDQFFEALRKAYESVNLPPLSAFPRVAQLTTYDIVRAFTRRDPGLPLQAVSPTCAGSPPRLREIRICLSKNLASAYCEGEIIQSSCSARTVELPLPH